MDNSFGSVEEVEHVRILQSFNGYIWKGNTSNLAPGREFFEVTCVSASCGDDIGIREFTIYEMMKGCFVWSVRYLANTEEFMNPLPEGWSIRSTVWSIGLGEKEEDSFLLINLSGKVVKYNIISKTINEIFDIGSNQMDDDDDVEFIPPFSVNPNLYEFIPSFAKEEDKTHKASISCRRLIPNLISVSSSVAADVASNSSAQYGLHSPYVDNGSRGCVGSYPVNNVFSADSASVGGGVVLYFENSSVHLPSGKQLPSSKDGLRSLLCLMMGIGFLRMTRPSFYETIVLIIYLGNLEASKLKGAALLNLSAGTEGANNLVTFCGKMSKLGMLDLILCLLKVQCHSIALARKHQPR
uniref:Uncharacterized protein n=1 Tax=Tanacetum cinerariifolium TaxID=118510 RepID=A0A6L2K742_TANCI|nr:hypothetical protein [Tanacetum cinerariifolium]